MQTYEQLSRLLAEAGVTTVFGVMGDGNMHWVAEYRGQPQCQWRPAWHEAGAVWMADGYAAATGELGVATVTMGPGLAQALAALTTAVRVRRPLLLITADVPATVPPQAQQAQQADWVAATGARYVAVHTSAALPAALVDALTSARRGDVTVLAVDVELFTEQSTDPTPAAYEVHPPLAPDIPPPDLQAAAAVLRTARAPLVVLGRGVLAGDGLAAALELGRRIGAAFATTLGGRIALPDEPFNLGLIGMMADPLTRAVAARADVVLVLGAALDRYNTDGGTLGPDAHLVRVDIRPPAELWAPGVRLTSVTGELAAVIPALLAELPPAPAPSTGLRTPELRAQLQTERARQDRLGQPRPADGANPWAMVAALDAALPQDAHIVVGIGHFWYFVAPYLRPGTDRRFHFSCGFGLIGQAVPVGVGAALALGERRPVIVIEGDGSLPMNVQEIQSAVRHDVDLLIVIVNNQAYGSEYHKLALAGLDVAGSEFDQTPFDVVRVAQAMGAYARQVSTPSELTAALAELLPRRGVRVIDAQVSRSSMSEAYERQHGSVPSH